MTVDPGTEVHARIGAGQCPTETTPTTVPCRTVSPVVTEGSTESSVLTRPSPWSIVTTALPATCPANDTVPSATATAEAPSGDARSMPRCPAE